MEKTALALAAVLALLVTAASGFFLIPLLHRLRFGQTIKEIGPTWHKEKQGTPTMGGFMFILGSSVGLLAAYPILSAAAIHFLPGDGGVLLLGMFTALAFAVIGFIDDYLKVVRHQNLGLRARYKLVMQVLVAVCFLATLHVMGRLSPLVRLPLFGTVNLGIAFYPLSLLLVVGMVNAVNLTDGLDGLAGSVTFFVMCGFLVIQVVFEQYRLALWAAALAGSCLGFLRWNFYPARVFMGDTGSMFFGGAVAALGYCMGRPDILIILGLVYLLEELSVMMQVSYFKLTHGKRIFKMTPIHHHFEMMGWSEVKIDVVFSLVALLCAAGAYVYAIVLG